MAGLDYLVTVGQAVRPSGMKQDLILPLDRRHREKARWKKNAGQRRRRIEFLDFMNRVVVAYPERQIHVVLDNLSTHKPVRDMWLKRHKNVHFHYTPTHASWLSQIEIWFSILTTRSLNGASFGSVKELVAHIEAFIERYNHTARPFLWTKSKVHQKRLRPCFADQ